MNESRQKVIDATIILLSQSGLSGAGLNDVIALSGASRGSLYHYFPDGKEQWVTEALLLYSERFWARCDAVITKAPTVAGGIAAIFDWAGEMMRSHHYRSGCPVGAVVLDLGAKNEALRKVCVQIIKKWERLLAARFSPLPAARARKLAKLVIGTFEGALMLARLERSSAPFTLAAEQLAVLLNARDASSLVVHRASNRQLPPPVQRENDGHPRRSSRRRQAGAESEA